MICLYHSADLDGQCSGAIVKLAHPDVELYPINYGDPVPDLNGKDVIVVDFSLKDWPESLIWIDHHKTAVHPDHGVIVFDVNKAACVLTWEFFFGTPVPLSVKLIGAHDIWDHSDPRTLPFQMAMRLEEEIDWEGIFTDCIDHYLANGKLILKYQTQQNARAARRLWFHINFEGYTWQAANIGGINSLFFDSVRDSSDGEIAFVWSKKGWTVSLFSETVDCGEIAKRYGGGGHRGAAGFICEKLPWQESLLPS